MTIETKYNVGDEVWRYDHPHNVKEKIYRISVLVDDEDDTPPVWINYYFGPGRFLHHETSIFNTEEELEQWKKGFPKDWWWRDAIVRNGIPS